MLTYRNGICLYIIIVSNQHGWQKVSQQLSHTNDFRNSKIVAPRSVPMAKVLISADKKWQEYIHLSRVPMFSFRHKRSCQPFTCPHILYFATVFTGENTYFTPCKVPCFRDFWGPQQRLVLRLFPVPMIHTPLSPEGWWRCHCHPGDLICIHLCWGPSCTPRQLD